MSPTQLNLERKALRDGIMLDVVKNKINEEKPNPVTMNVFEMSNLIIKNHDANK